MKEYTNEELEHLKKLHELFVEEGFDALTECEKGNLLHYLHDTTKHQAAAQSGVLAAINFERSVKQVLDRHIKQGLTVSQAAGVLSLVKTEVEMSFLMKIGHVLSEEKPEDEDGIVTP